MSSNAKNDFSQGKVWACILSQAIPLTVAQMVHVLYNLVDRIYLGHLPGASSLALTGVGLIFPIVSVLQFVWHRRRAAVLHCPGCRQP